MPSSSLTRPEAAHGRGAPRAISSSSTFGWVLRTPVQAPTFSGRALPRVMIAPCPPSGWCSGSSSLTGLLTIAGASVRLTTQQPKRPRRVQTVLHEENVPDLRTKRGTMDGAWLATPTGLLVPNHSRINRARSTNIRQPNRILDWVNSLATVASVFVAVLSIIVAVLAQREQQAAETARRATEQAMLQQTRQQIALQARIAQLETRQIVLQEKIRAQNLDLTQRLLRSEVGQVATP